MIFYNVVVYCVLILSYSKVVISNEGKKKPPKNGDDVKHTFAKLLKTIVRVNEERMDAMRKITELQDYMLTKNKLKTDEYTYDSLEDDDTRLLVAFANTPQLRRTEDETITRAMCNRINLEKNYVHLWTNQFLKQACRNHSIGLCVSACKKSVAKLCEKFYCNHKTRSDFRSECHDNCRNTFEHVSNQLYL